MATHEQIIMVAKQLIMMFRFESQPIEPSHKDSSGKGRDMAENPRGKSNKIKGIIVYFDARSTV